MQEGSLLECIIESPEHWGWDQDHIIPDFGPKYKDIVTCDGVGVFNGTKYVTLLEYPEIDPHDNERYWFAAAGFREIQPPMSITESLFNQSPEKITV